MSGELLATIRRSEDIYRDVLSMTSFVGAEGERAAELRAVAVNNLGVLLTVTGRASEAVSLFESNERFILDSILSSFYFNYAEALLKLGRRFEAYDALRRGLMAREAAVAIAPAGVVRALAVDQSPRGEADLLGAALALVEPPGQLPDSYAVNLLSTLIDSGQSTVAGRMVREFLLSANWRESCACKDLEMIALELMAAASFLGDEEWVTFVARISEEGGCVGGVTDLWDGLLLVLSGSRMAPEFDGEEVEELLFHQKLPQSYRPVVSRVVEAVADSRLAAKEFESAAALYSYSVALDPENVEAVASLLNCFFVSPGLDVNGRFLLDAAEAVEGAGRLTALSPVTFTGLNIVLGDAFMVRGMSSGRKEYLRRAFAYWRTALAPQRDPDAVQDINLFRSVFQRLERGYQSAADLRAAEFYRDRVKEADSGGVVLREWVQSEPISGGWVWSEEEGGFRFFAGRIESGGADEEVDLGRGEVRAGRQERVKVIGFVGFGDDESSEIVEELERVSKAMGGRVDVELVSLPDRRRVPDSQKAAEALFCAKEMGKEREMRNAILMDGDHIRPSELVMKALGLGLSGSEFRYCLYSGRYADAVDSHLDLGYHFGVSELPIVFVNGTAIEGRFQYPKLANAIDQELAVRSR